MAISWGPRLFLFLPVASRQDKWHAIVCQRLPLPCGCGRGCLRTTRALHSALSSPLPSHVHPTHGPSPRTHTHNTAAHSYPTYPCLPARPRRRRSKPKHPPRQPKSRLRKPRHPPRRKPKHPPRRRKAGMPSSSANPYSTGWSVSCEIGRTEKRRTGLLSSLARKLIVSWRGRKNKPWHENEYRKAGTLRLTEEKNKHVKARPKKVSEEWQAH